MNTSFLKTLKEQGSSLTYPAIGMARYTQNSNSVILNSIGGTYESNK
jgi:FMN-dependent NADH-azoreductase